jgi:hypothetical protein
LEISHCLLFKNLSEISVNRSIADDEDRQYLEKYQKWAIGELHVPGTKSQRHYQLESPNQEINDELDGVY